VGALNGWYEEHKAFADFVVVYVREAHPADGWQVGQNVKQGLVYNEPTTYGARKEIARKCEVGLALKVPIVVDKMDDAVEKAYAGWPDRIYIVGTDGRIAFVGAPGPAGFKPDEARKALLPLIGKSG
jgi:hypothetical protein